MHSIRVVLSPEIITPSIPKLCATTSETTLLWVLRGSREKGHQFRIYICLFYDSLDDYFNLFVAMFYLIYFFYGLNCRFC
jgi:hypothetical protein